MSPLPELTPARKFDRQADKRNVDKFFNDDIPSDEKWVWVVSNPNDKIREEYFKEKGVNFEGPPHTYITGGQGNKEFHNVYSTPQTGLYLELIFDEHALSKGSPESLIKYAVRSEFHRLGEKRYKGYIISLIEESP